MLLGKLLLAATDSTCASEKTFSPALIRLQLSRLLLLAVMLCCC
jgi:hypothetical protein